MSTSPRELFKRTRSLISRECFAGQALETLRGAQAEDHYDMVMIGDFGKDQDDEKALAMAVSLHRLGLLKDLSVIANLGDSRMRARLAKGTLNVLGVGGFPVAAGTDVGRANEQIQPYEFACCTYLAEDYELAEMDGTTLFYTALQKARENGRKVLIVLNSGLTDMAEAIRDPRWREWGRDVVKVVSASGALLMDENGRLMMDGTAQNNAFDLESAEYVHNALAQEPNVQFMVVSRFAAMACQLPRCSIDGSSHPLAKRLSGVAEPSLQKLWERVHLTEEERADKGDALPMRCSPSWFRSTFLVEHAPELTASDAVWSHVRGFNEYDGLNTIAAVAAAYPGLFTEFFDPQCCPVTGSQCIGISKEVTGLKNGHKMSELLHDVLATSFERRFYPGLAVDVLVDGEWKAFQLIQNIRDEGPDTWRLGNIDSFATEDDTKEENKESSYKTLALSAVTEGIRWRLNDIPGAKEPVTVGVCNQPCRRVNGMNVPPHMSQAGHNLLRRELTLRNGDVFITTGPRAGATFIQQAALVLRANGVADNVDMNKPFFLEASVGRGRHDITSIDMMPFEDRVFKSMGALPSLFPCRPYNATTIAPPGAKIIHCVRDPRAMCVSHFDVNLANFQRFSSGNDGNVFNWDEFVAGFIDGKVNFTAPNWITQELKWWEYAKTRPDEVLWLCFEESMRDPESMVRKVSTFLGLENNESVIDSTVAALAWPTAKRRWGKSLGILLGDEIEHSGRTKLWLERYSAAQLQRFQSECIDPAIASGMPNSFAPSIHEL